MKKLLALLLALAMVFSLAACGGTEETTAAAEEETTAAEAEEETTAAEAEEETTAAEAEEETTAAAAGEFDRDLWMKEWEPDGIDYPEMTVVQGTIVNLQNTDYADVRGFLLLKNYVEGKSGGKITWDIQDNGVLGGDEALLEQLSVGSIQIDTPAMTNLSQYDPEFDAGEIPFMFSSRDAAIEAMNGEFGQYFKDHLDPSFGFQILGYYYYGARSMTNNVRPIETMADMQGLKMRVMNSDIYIKMMECLGAVPTPISFDELFTAMQQGTVDGQENPASSIHGYNFFEVQKYFSDTQHVYAFAPVLTNPDWFAAQTPEVQQLIQEAIDVYADYVNSAYAAEEENDYHVLEQDGMICNKISDEAKAEMIEACAPIIESYRGVWSDELFTIIENMRAD